MSKNNKKGSYLVEAAITLPVMIISICSLILIIKIIALCENITFATSTNLLDSMFCYYNKLNIITLCSEIEESSHHISDFKITKLDYLYVDDEVEDLIALDAEAKFNVFSTIGINGNISFNEKVLCRAFSGKVQPKRPLSEEEFCGTKRAVAVFIFPKYGERYHRYECRYVMQNNLDKSGVLQMDREDALRKGYTPCIVCQGAAYE